MIGKTVGQYRITEKLGAGGMGEVYLAQDTRLDRKVALKFLTASHCSEFDFKARFEHEAKATAALNHPNIVTVYDLGEHDGQLFIAMEYLPGETLASIIEKQPLPIRRALDITGQISRALSAAHSAGIIHRDIKPANILIGDDDRTKVVDFGLAKSQKATTETQAGSGMGTVRYESPEQCRGQSVDKRSDLFSLGVTLYEMITGQPPFSGEYDEAIRYSIMQESPAPLSRYTAEASEDLQRIVSKLLEKEADIRYQSADDLLADLKKLSGAGATGAAASDTHSIAVLPFANLSAEPEQEYFCDGIAEDIINDLTKIASLRVAARTSSFAYKGKNEDIREIGRKLNVTSVLEGSVRKAGNKLRISAQLINVADGYHLWSERFDRDMEDVFAIQSEIARKVSEALKITLTSEEKSEVAKCCTSDVKAYDYYLRGRAYFDQFNLRSLTIARDMFERAINEDPDYALAYAGLADCSSRLFQFFAQKSENLEQALESSQKALSLDPELSEAHAARGLALSLSQNYAEAERELKKALKLNPNQFEAYEFLGRIYMAQGRQRDSADAFIRAREIRPDDYQSHIMVGRVIKGLDMEELRIKELERGAELARERLETHPDDVRAMYLLAGALVELGQKDEGFKLAERALSLNPDDPVLVGNIARLYVIVGDFERAFVYLKQARELGFGFKGWALHDPDLAPLRDDPRFLELLDSIEEPQP